MYVLICEESLIVCDCIRGYSIRYKHARDRGVERRSLERNPLVTDCRHFADLRSQLICHAGDKRASDSARPLKNKGSD